MKDLPPEERLLRLIKGTHKKDKLPEEKPQEPDAEAQKGIPEEKKPEPQKAAVPIGIGVKEERLDLFKVTIILLIGLFAMGILYFSYEFFRQRQQPPVIDIEKLISPEVKLAEEKPVEEKKPITEEGPSLSELAKNLVLVGAITGDNPQAIIQDKRTRQTFYVYEGESVLEFKIKKIEKAVVILEHNGETLKLSL